MIVYAHFEGKSFNAAMLGAARRTLEDLGHKVQVSDLYAEAFCPVPNPSEFRERVNADHFELMAEQANSNALGLMPVELKREQDRIRWADALILQFPFWWWSVPAILKGWIDRVLSNGFAYGSRNLSGKQAMLAMTAETSARRFEATAEYPVLDHLESGTLRYCGLAVLPPFVAAEIHSLTRGQRERLLETFAEHLAQQFPPYIGH